MKDPKEGVTFWVLLCIFVVCLFGVLLYYIYTSENDNATGSPNDENSYSYIYGQDSKERNMGYKLARELLEEDDELRFRQCNIDFCWIYLVNAQQTKIDILEQRIQALESKIIQY